MRALFHDFGNHGFLIYFFLGPGLPRKVPSFFNRRPCASRGALLPGFGPRFFGALVVAFLVLAVVLFFDPAGRPRFLGAELDFVTGFLAVLAAAVFFDPAGRPRFFGAAVVLVAGFFADFTLALVLEVAVLALDVADPAKSPAESLTLSAADFVFSTALLVAALAFSPAVLERSLALRACLLYTSPSPRDRG